MGPRSVRSHFLSLGKRTGQRLRRQPSWLTLSLSSVLALVLYSNCYSIPFSQCLVYSTLATAAAALESAEDFCAARTEIEPWHAGQCLLSPSFMFCATNTERVIHLPSCGRGEIHHRNATHISAPHPIVNIVIIYKVYSIKRNDLKPRLIDLLLCAAWDGNPSCTGKE
jgi:hypothetical protein